MKNNHTSVVVASLPQCDFCREDPTVLHQVAHVDGRTKMGPWANMCREHFKKFGVGLGLGKGQELTLPTRGKSARDKI